MKFSMDLQNNLVRILIFVPSIYKANGNLVINFYQESFTQNKLFKNIKIDGEIHL